MDAQVIVSHPGALERLTRTLQSYRAVSGRTSEEVLVKKGEDLAQRGPNGTSLHSLFQQQAKRHGAITAAAKARGFRLGRRRWGGSGPTAGISEEAARRAERVMGPYLKAHSILANVSYDGGRLTLRGVRQGRSGKRILGGRRGLGGFAVGGDNEALRRPWDKRLNFRAVATVMEINLREAGRKFLATGFLFRRFARIQRQRQLVAMNPRSQLEVHASAQLEGSADSGNIVLRLSSHVPGTAEIGNSRGIFARALGYMTEDMEIYLARKQRETL
ncbi:MAG TPA: hypothetical protein VEC14_14140, partial [Reyranellaceae bacterium]|nr:hypothetical protein [Reyranellaceae bacterium]